MTEVAIVQVINNSLVIALGIVSIYGSGLQKNVLIPQAVYGNIMMGFRKKKYEDFH